MSSLSCRQATTNQCHLPTSSSCLSTDKHRKDTITAVSGYWDVVNKHTSQSFNRWFENTLKINQRYIFFCNNDTQAAIASFRGDHETSFIVHPLEQFYAKLYTIKEWKHPIHVPSNNLGMIWHEKIHMIKLAKDNCIQTNTSTEFYIWIDAGICTYRNVLPPTTRLTIADVNALPHDKIIYTDSQETLHRFSGTSFLLHHTIIDDVHELYYKELTLCNQQRVWECGVDQIIFTRLMNKYPHMFLKVGNGYGTLLGILYEKYAV